MFFSFVCNVGHSFLSFSHLIIHSIHEFCCITSHDEILEATSWELTLPVCPDVVTKWFSVPYGLRTSVEKSCFVMRTCCNILQEALSDCPDWSCVVAYSFPLLRKPNTVVIQFWTICWREAHCFLTGCPSPSSPTTDFQGSCSLKLKTTRTKASSQ